MSAGVEFTIDAAVQIVAGGNAMDSDRFAAAEVALPMGLAYDMALGYLMFVKAAFPQFAPSVTRTLEGAPTHDPETARAVAEAG